MLKLEIGANVMLKVNIGMQDRLINGQTGNISHIEFAEGSVFVKYMQSFKMKSRLKNNDITSFIQTKFLCSYCKYETEIPIKRGFSSPSITHTQFSLTTSYSFIHSFIYDVLYIYVM